MKIPRSALEKIVYEEFIRFIGEMNEAPTISNALDSVEDPDTEDAEDVPETGVDEPVDADAAVIPDEDDVGEDEDESPPIVSNLAQELQNKVVQSVSMNKKSKMMPGASEIVFTFEDTPDAFRILFTKTGKIKFFYQGLHNNLGDISPEGEEKEGDEEYSLAPDDIDDVPAGDSVAAIDTERSPKQDKLEDDEDEAEDIEV